jgi:hypothetical protein
LKETVQIRIAEEANLRLIKVKTLRSDSNNLIVAGRNFYVCATYSVQSGWQVSKACCREDDNFSIIPQNHRVFKQKGLQAPFKSKRVSHLLWNAVEETPGLLYQIMRKLLKPHFNEYVLTNNVLQEARDTAKGDLFGDPDNNVRYAYAIANTLQKVGHTVKVIFTDQRETMQTVNSIALKEEMERQKAAKSGLSRYSVYGINANGTMSALGFVLLFGNEDKKSWRQFWTFIKNMHPSINQSKYTIITDQDKGSLSAMEEIIPLAGRFLCSFHCRQNIMKKYGGGTGQRPLSTM